jgi:hypothetical protein
MSRKEKACAHEKGSIQIDKTVNLVNQFSRKLSGNVKEFPTASMLRFSQKLSLRKLKKLINLQITLQPELKHKGYCFSNLEIPGRTHHSS